MKLSLAVGILSSQTLPVLLEAKVLSTTKLDADGPRSSVEEPLVLRGGNHLVGSTTTPLKTTNISLQQQQSASKKAVECVPSQEESAEADYDLGVLACATTTTGTTAGQICVASDDSTLGGYCMDPPPLTYDDSRRLLKRFSDDGLLRKYCANPTTTDISPIDECQCSSLVFGFVACS